MSDSEWFDLQLSISKLQADLDLLKANLDYVRDALLDVELSCEA